MNRTPEYLWGVARAALERYRAAETAAARAALEASGWLAGRAADLLGVPHSSFRRVIKRSGLEDEVRRKRGALTGPHGGRPIDTLEEP